MERTGLRPQNNLVLVGEVQWCTTVRIEPTRKIEGVAKFTPWSAEDSINPFNVWGKPDPVFQWAGWLYAVDADSGQWRWRAKTNYPVQSGVAPTAGGVVFFGDMGGNFYALDADTGRELWGEKIGGAVGGGVITYTTLRVNVSQPRPVSRKSSGQPRLRQPRFPSWPCQELSTPRKIRYPQPPRLSY